MAPKFDTNSIISKYKVSFSVSAFSRDTTLKVANFFRQTTDLTLNGPLYTNLRLRVTPNGYPRKVKDTKEAKVFIPFEFFIVCTVSSRNYETEGSRTLRPKTLRLNRTLRPII